jgi:hypothetical protein
MFCSHITNTMLILTLSGNIWPSLVITNSLLTEIVSENPKQLYVLISIESE